MRRDDAIFNFYSRLHMYFVDIRNALGEPNNTVLLELYTKDCLRGANGITRPTKGKKQKFRTLMKSVICFLKRTDNQIPLSRQVFENLIELKKIFVTFQYLGIDHPRLYDKFDNNSPVKEKHAEIKKMISTVINDIQQYQKKTVDKLPKP